MKKEEMMSVISDKIQIIEDALSEINEREEYPILNDRIAVLGNFDDKELPFIQHLTKFIVRNSDEFMTKPGLNGGVLRTSSVKAAIQKKNDDKANAKKEKSARAKALKEQIKKELEAKMTEAAISTNEPVQALMGVVAEQRFPLDEDEPEDNVD